MTADRRRIAFLKRLARVRAIERRQAAWQLAEARSTQARMFDLAARSRDLAADYAGLRPTADAQSLLTRHSFRAQLTSMAGEAAQMGDAAERGAQQAGVALARAEHRADTVNERIASEQRRVALRRVARAQLDASGLARRLRNQGE